MENSKEKKGNYLKERRRKKTKKRMNKLLGITIPATILINNSNLIAMKRNDNKVYLLYVHRGRLMMIKIDFG